MNDLPALDNRRIDEIEAALFADIARERAEGRARDDVSAARRRRRRRTWWGASGAAAAVIVVAAAIAPQLTSSSGGASSVAPATAPDTMFGAPENGDMSRDAGGSAPQAEPFALDGSADEGVTSGTVSDSPAGRDVVATASATVVVADPRAAAESIGAAAVATGGYVESMSLGGTPTGALPYADDRAVWPAASGSAWVLVRVPAASLEDAVAGLSDVGEVETSQVSRDDVTTQTTDLRARVAAGQASVKRLTELMGEAGSVADLIAAESALAERQADLDSLQQQLTALESQVALSSLTVQLQAPAEKVDADPAGFGDGLATGWNGLIATFNGIIVALGFLLPWLIVIGLTAALIWLVVSTTRRRRARRNSTAD
ncbi:DUF4349 domain-containing protein [Microbacterium arborescens]|uniref:DUF4349 domain-containing protein n=1 Tax=Microbacterium arborescens TaxID=33883 RepID=UPI0025A28EB2|nr:DUF4349 domain-containing protein [Microbacterium arborescens]WJM17102.1 DUF4349 domain-containing protein [Microbacterium arborescens]